VRRIVNSREVKKVKKWMTSGIVFPWATAAVPYPYARFNGASPTELKKMSKPHWWAVPKCGCPVK
jgi:hypothetical protein